MTLSNEIGSSKEKGMSEVLLNGSTARVNGEGARANGYQFERSAYAADEDNEVWRRDLNLFV
ncbi:hypothetical protein N7453_004387 [Penicillium expansum]|nr:hypothetical protein N7453_004387 [Penicillium expansum]